MDRVDWKEAKEFLVDRVSGQEAAILELLSSGYTQPGIGRELGLHRSSVWRRVRKLRQLLFTVQKSSGSAQPES